MRSENATWPDTYRAVIQDFDDLPPYEKSYQAEKLRRAVASLMKRRSAKRAFEGGWCR